VFPGRYYLRVSHSIRNDLLTTPEFEVEAGGLTDLGEIAVGEGGAVELEIVGVPARFLRGASFSLERRSANSVSLEWRDDLLVADGLMPGEWIADVADTEFYLALEGAEPGEARISVEAGRIARASLRMERSVRVLFACGATEDGRLVVAIQRADGSLLRRHYKNADETEERTFSLSFPPGRYRIEVTAESGRKGATSIEVGDSPPDPVRIELR
jgi:hypothetical protein